MTSVMVSGASGSAASGEAVFSDSFATAAFFLAFCGVLDVGGCPKSNSNSMMQDKHCTGTDSLKLRELREA